MGNCFRRQYSTSDYRHHEYANHIYFLSGESTPIFHKVDEILETAKRNGIDLRAIYDFYASECLYVYKNLCFVHMRYREITDDRMNCARYMLYYLILKGFPLPAVVTFEPFEKCNCREKCIMSEQDAFKHFVLRSGGVGFIIRVQRRFRLTRAARKIQRWWLAISYNPHHPMGHQIQIGRWKRLVNS